MSAASRPRSSAMERPTAITASKWDGPRATLSFQAAGKSADYQMRIAFDVAHHGLSPDGYRDFRAGELFDGRLSAHAVPAAEILVNLFDGGPRSKGGFPSRRRPAAAHGTRGPNGSARARELHSSCGFEEVLGRSGPFLTPLERGPARPPRPGDVHDHDPGRGRVSGACTTHTRFWK